MLVTITYRDWAAMEPHSEAEIAARLFPQWTLKPAPCRRLGCCRSHRAGSLGGSRWTRGVYLFVGLDCAELRGSALLVRGF